MSKEEKDTGDNALILDLDSIFKWIFSNDANSDMQITETYQKEENEQMELIERQVNEVKNRSDSTIPTIKYDFIKLCITELEKPLGNNGKTIASSLIENTLFYNKMIKNVKI